MRLRSRQAWVIAVALAIALPIPWSILSAAPFAWWAGWTLVKP